MFEEELNVTKQMMLQLGADRNTNLGHHNSMERIALLSATVSPASIDTCVTV